MDFGICMFSLFFLLLLSFRCFISSNAQSSVPALFFLGDSLVDVGTNHHIPLCLARADFPPYGIDFPTKKPTGRFCNGKNSADFLSEKLNMPTPPAFLSVDQNLFGDGPVVFTGVSFASGGSGILPATGKQYGVVVPLPTQVDQYVTVYEQLVNRLGAEPAKDLLRKSIFVIVIGSNDIISYSLFPDLRKKRNPQQYADMMVAGLKVQINRLHGYGAYKFAVAGVGPIGCTPLARSKNQGNCDENMNSWVDTYNEGLKSLLQELKSNELKDINYSYMDIGGIFDTVVQNATSYGFAEVKVACCGLGKMNADVPCLPIAPHCSDRTTHVFWDFVHPTEAVDRIMMDSVYDDASSRYTSPINVKQLVEL